MRKMDQVLACIREHGPLSATEVAQRMGGTRASLHSTLQALAARGVISRVYGADQLRWEAVEPGERAGYFVGALALPRTWLTAPPWR